ncbi:uncharacterized protein IL334_007166 [Kwoniella shivajii]|uniref:Uncharacterized protein n=1 Tax=Kwoniella shivajii TaxID=564305 RepID=A0ABZ1D997_9TREE|nr:hypothetical protein IL334_007166 [Kwoniella shivajii]
MPTTPRPPKLIITPCTPSRRSVDYFILPDSLPSPSASPTSSTFYHEYTEKSRPRSTSPSSSEKRPKAIRSYSLPSESYLSPPSPLPRPRSGKRPLRSPLISILFLIFAFMLVVSTVMCTSPSAGRLLDIQRKAGEKIHIMLKGCDPSKSIISPDAEGEELIGTTGIGRGLIDLIWSREEWEHYTNTVTGPAMSLDGAVWDYDS